MNYANGAVYDGEWNDGVSSTPGKTREEPMMSTSGGFGGSGSMMQSRSIPRRFRHEQRATCTLGQGGRSYLATLNEDGSSSDYEYSPSSSRSSSRSASRSQSVSPPNLPQSELQAKVVCGMLWTDVHGATGAYTGEVNCLNIPDGMGSMRYDHGVVTEGMWRDGERVDDNGVDDDDDDDDYSDGDERGVTMSSSGSYQGRGGVPSSSSSSSYGLASGLASLPGARGGGSGYHHRGGAASVH